MQDILKMPFLSRSLFFAELSLISYYDAENIKKNLKNTDFRLLNVHDVGGAQAYSFVSSRDIVIVCRGTEADCWSDLRADLHAWPKKSRSGGRVHSGFSWHIDKIWRKITTDLKMAEQKHLNIWFTGHSLGAAMSTILASRCQYSNTLPDPIQLYTYGSPRVGWPKYVDALAINHIRWVNNNDIVARVPPRWMGYKHHGVEYYMNTWGNIRTLTNWQRVKDKIRGMVLSWKNGEVDSFTDHSITCYVENLKIQASGMKTLQSPVFKVL